MEKQPKKIRTILLGVIIIFVTVVIYSGMGGIGGEKGKKEERGEFATLEEALMNIEGVGKVSLHFHYENGETVNALSDYFSLSGTSNKKGNELQGILVVAEGAGDSKIQSKLSKILSTVLQLSEHRIVIEEMKKGE